MILRGILPWPAEYSIAGAGCWVLGAGCWVLGAGAWAQIVGSPPRRASTRYHRRRARGTAILVRHGGVDACRRADPLVSGHLRAERRRSTAAPGRVHVRRVDRPGPLPSGRPGRAALPGPGSPPARGDGVHAALLPAGRHARAALRRRVWAGSPR